MSRWPSAPWSSSCSVASAREEAGPRVGPLAAVRQGRDRTMTDDHSLRARLSSAVEDDAAASPEPDDPHVLVVPEAGEAPRSLRDAPLAAAATSPDPATR